MPFLYCNIYYEVFMYTVISVLIEKHIRYVSESSNNYLCYCCATTFLLLCVLRKLGFILGIKCFKLVPENHVFLSTRWSPLWVAYQSQTKYHRPSKSETKSQLELFRLKVNVCASARTSSPP